jgi:hypothetical protein
MNHAQATRPPTQLAPPTLLSNAFDNPQEVLDLIKNGAPYKSITAVQKEPEGTRAAPWFRNFWALGGKVIFPGAEQVFHNPNFIDAAKEHFGARIISPLAMMTNLNVPAPAGDPHLDLPFFRGAHKREVPLWLLAPMGYSGLFQRWAIPVASVITWFYGGKGGGFEYWPNGLQAASEMHETLFKNQGIIGDNEYMYHRVRQIGDDSQFLRDNQIPYDAMLEHTKSGWQITAQGKLLTTYAAEQVRTSVLWKAYCFADQAEADAFNSGTDNLAPRQIVDIFQADLQHRGIRIDTPGDLTEQSEWSQTVQRTYVAQS